jgi:hypothetical protein
MAQTGTEKKKKVGRDKSTTWKEVRHEGSEIRMKLFPVEFKWIISVGLLITDGAVISLPTYDN